MGQPVTSWLSASVPENPHNTSKRPAKALLLLLLARILAGSSDPADLAAAMDLMQLLPATAKQIARHQGLSYSSAHQLIDPTTNIQLGTAYLGSMK
jgi:soluble lytic murein transglycosylase